MPGGAGRGGGAAATMGGCACTPAGGASVGTLVAQPGNVSAMNIAKAENAIARIAIPLC